MADPKVRDMLLAKVDELVTRMAGQLDEIKTVTEQLEPERAPVVPQRDHEAAVMIDEIKLRAHAPPDRQRRRVGRLRRRLEAWWRNRRRQVPVWLP